MIRLLYFEQYYSDCIHQVRVGIGSAAILTSNTIPPLLASWLIDGFWRNLGAEPTAAAPSVKYRLEN